MIRIYQKVVNDIDQELIKASEKHSGRFNSLHEGYGILKEEVDELWDDIKVNAPVSQVYIEAKQVAAMAIRIMQECCGKECGDGK